MKLQFEKTPFLGDFINGEFIGHTHPNGHFEKRDPGFISSLVMEGSFKYDHVNQACDAAKRAFRSWADLGIEGRGHYLLRLKEAYISHAKELATFITREVGKPFWESEQEVQTMISKIDITLNESLKLVADQKIKMRRVLFQGFYVLNLAA